MTLDAEGIASRPQIEIVLRTVRAVAAHTRQALAADRMEPMRQVAVAAFAQDIGAVLQQSVDIAAVGIVAGCALLAQSRRMLAAAKIGRLCAMARAAQLTGRGLQQTGMAAAMRHMARRTVAGRHRLVLNPTLRQIMTFAAIVGRYRGQGRRALPVEFAVTLRTFAGGYRIMRAAGAAQDDVGVAFDAGHGHLHAAGLGLVRRVAGSAGGQIVGAVTGEGVLAVELLGMAGFAQRILALHQQIGIVAAMTIVTQQTLAHGQAGMRLADHLLMIFVAGVARLRLGGGQQRNVGADVEAAVAVGALAGGKGLVGMAKAVGGGQIGVALLAGIPIHHNFRGRLRIMRIMTQAAFDTGVLGMSGETDVGIKLIGVACAAELRLRLPQNGGVFRSVRQMAEIALPLGNLGMGLLDHPPQILMTAITGIGHAGRHQLGIGAGVRLMTIGALAVLEWLMRMGDRIIRIRHFLPMAIPADPLLRAPQLFGIRSAQIVASATSPIAKGGMHIVQAVQRRRPQTRRNRIRRWRGREKRGRGRGWRFFWPGRTATTIQNQYSQNQQSCQGRQIDCAMMGFEETHEKDCCRVMRAL